MDRRWYDREPACSNLLMPLKGIYQPEVRDFSARIMIHFCERLRKSLASKDKLSSRVKSLGVNALTSIYNFRNHNRRWYDHSPELHKALSYLYTLPEGGLGVIGHKLGDTFGLLQVYSAVCHQLGQVPAQQEMTKIALTALKSGQKEAEEVLVAIVGRDLYNAISDTIHQENP
jgi:hypothetical protein